MKTTPTMIRAAAVAALLAPALAAAPASAQDRQVPEITVTPSGPGGTGNYGAYGRQLPGVYMLTNNGLPTTPTINEGQVRLPNNEVLVNRYTYQRTLPWLDAWHGTIGPGIPF